MSGTIRNGRNGVFLFDTSSGGASAAVQILAKNKWSVDNSANPFDTTSMGDSNKTAGVDLPDAKLTVSGFWDAADTAWKNVIGASVGRKGYLYPDLTNNPTDYFYGSFYVSLTSDGGTTGPVNQNWALSASGWAGWH